jgi:hypothetical protein
LLNCLQFCWLNQYAKSQFLYAYFTILDREILVFMASDLMASFFLPWIPILSHFWVNSLHPKGIPKGFPKGSPAPRFAPAPPPKRPRLRGWDDESGATLQRRAEELDWRRRHGGARFFFGKLLGNWLKIHGYKIYVIICNSCMIILIIFHTFF